MIPNSKEVYKYKLYGVLIHEGFSINSGHYYCYVNNSSSWLCMNDSMVTKSIEKNVLQQLPYILFYQREVLHFPKLTDVNFKRKESITQEVKKEIISNKIIPSPTNSTIIIKPEEAQKEVKQERIIPSIEQSIAIYKPQETKPDVIVQILELKQTEIPNEEEYDYKKTCYSDYFVNIEFEKDFKKFSSKKRRILKKYLKSLKKEKGIKKYKIGKILEEEYVSADTPTKSSSLDLKEREDIKIKIPTSQNHSTNFIYNRNLTNLYGMNNISQWESDTEADSDLLRKQINFIRKSEMLKETEVLRKDEYDEEYDKGKLKKIKSKVPKNDRSFLNKRRRIGNH
jgi:hypothetical protein